MVGKCKNSSKFAFAWEWEGRNQGSKFSHLLSIWFWGLVPGLTDCNELFVTEKTAQRYFHFVWFSLVHKPSSSESLFEIVRKAKKLFRFKQTVLPWGKLPNHHWWCKGQKILCQERAKGCSNASSFSWSSRQEERLGFFACYGWLCLGHRACLWWDRAVSQEWNRVHQGNECSCLSSTFTGPTSVLQQVGISSSAQFSTLFTALSSLLSNLVPG